MVLIGWCNPGDEQVQWSVEGVAKMVWPGHNGKKLKDKFYDAWHANRGIGYMLKELYEPSYWKPFLSSGEKHDFYNPGNNLN